MRGKKIRKVSCFDLPKNPNTNTIYELQPKDPSDEYYFERTDRNIGWITREEQEMLRKMTVGVAGCGGMGGLLGQIFLRLGIGHVKIADPEVFDISNINRQFGATRPNIGVSKAIATAQLLRQTTDDTKLTVYPQGIHTSIIDDFLKGCDVVCDEIEFWAIGSRILLHQKARPLNIPLFNCNTIGFGTRLFMFTPNGETMEQCFGVDYEKAVDLQNKIQSKQASKKEIDEVMQYLFKGLVTEIPEYCWENNSWKNVPTCIERLFSEGKASIIATNPIMASGFVADRVLLELLQRHSEVKREIAEIPQPPGYLYFDAAKMIAKIVEG